MKTTQQLIAETKTANPSATTQQIYSLLNTPRTIPNPVARGQVLPVINLTEIAGNISPSERFKIENQAGQTWQALLTNLSQNKIPDAVHNVENLIASGLLTAETIAILTTQLGIAVMPIDDPNWKASVFVSPAEENKLEILIGDIPK